MSFGLGVTGFTPKRLADIKAELEADFKSRLGAAINIDPQGPLGQIIGTISERESLVWEEMEAVYYSRYPSTAEGVSLDRVVEVTNIFRLMATKSNVTARVSGTNGTSVPAGFTASVSGSPASRFISAASGIIGSVSSGYVDIVFEAETAGSTQAPSGTLTVIETPVSGVTSVTNTLDAVVGRETETDTQLRIRRAITLNRPGTATVNGIRNAILNVDNVLQANIVENDTGLYDSDGRPPHSFEAVVSGGNDADIAAAIFASKAAGIETFGEESETVVDSQGTSHTVKFSRPDNKEIYLRVTITPNVDPNEGTVYPSTGDDSIISAIIEFSDAIYVLGHDVILSQFYTPINTIEGVFGILVEASLNGSSWQTTNISVAADELAVFDTSRITVVHA